VIVGCGGDVFGYLLHILVIGTHEHNHTYTHTHVHVP
jgi:hypothetical protein